MYNRSHRRDFVRSLAAGASAAALMLPASARADDDTKKDAKPKDQKNEPEAPKTEVDARMDFVLARFGKHLDEEAQKSVRSELNGMVRRAETLRKFALENGDGPFPVFRPYRAPVV
jgi:hypothetical protein